MLKQCSGQGQGSIDIDAPALIRVAEAVSDRCLGREMHHGVRPRRAQQNRHALGVQQIERDNFVRGRNIAIL